MKGMAEEHRKMSTAQFSTKGWAESGVPMNRRTSVGPNSLKFRSTEISED